MSKLPQNRQTETDGQRTTPMKERDRDLGSAMHQDQAGTSAEPDSLIEGHYDANTVAGLRATRQENPQGEFGEIDHNVTRPEGVTQAQDEKSSG